FQAYINANSVSPTKAEVRTDENGKAEASELNLGVYLVVETTVPDGFIATTNSFLVSVPYWDQEIDKDTDKDGLEGDWVYNVTAYPKDEPYSGTLDKEIVSDEDGQKTNTDSLSIGDTVNFEVKGKVPNYGKSVQDTTNTQVSLTQDRAIITKEVYDVLPFVFTDTLSTGLTYNDNLVIQAGTEPLTQDTGATLSEDGKTVTWTENSTDDYFVKFDESTNKLTVIVKWDSIDAQQGNAITFTYNAIVNADAVVTTGNGNDATIYVANNPSTFNGDYSNLNTDEYASSNDKSTVYTYQLDLTKTFDGQTVPAGVNASDVKFEIYQQNEDGSNKSVHYFITEDAASGQYTLWTREPYTEGDKTYAVVDVIKADGTQLTTADTEYT
ncbi:MAG: isopeptide-forming domain-containing fimbrial protein, partial [Acutalibacteraceae bacterium]